MKVLLSLLLVATILFSQAQQTSALVNRETTSAISITCIIMISLISLSIAGLTYYLVTKNKRRGINENSSSLKNT